MADLPSGATFGSLVHGVLEDGRPVRRPTSRPSSRATSRSSGAGGRSTPGRGAGRGAGAAAPHLARPAAPRPDPRRDRAGRPALRARLRDPAGRRRPGRARRERAPWPTSARCSTAPRRRRPAAPVRRPAPGPGLGGQSLRGYLSGSIDVVLRVPGDAGPALPRRRLQDQLARPSRPAAHRGRLLPRRGWPRRCCTPTTRCRRCSTSSSCTATCAGASPATTRPRTSAGVLYLYVRGMCGPETPRTTATRPASSRGCRRPRWSTALSDLLDGVPVTEELAGPARPPAGAAPPAGCCATFNEAGVLDAADVHVAQRRLRAGRRRRRRWSRWRWRFVVRGGPRRLGLRRPRRRSPTGVAAARPAVADARGVVAGAAGPRSAGQRRWRARCCGCSTIGCSTSTATGARRSRSTPTWSPGRRRSTLSPTRPAALEAGLDRVFPERGLRRAARRRPGRAHPGHHRAHRRARHRQDHHRRRAARAAGRAGRAPASPRCASRSPRRPARPRPGSSRRSRSEVARLPEADRARLTGVRAVTLHRLLGLRGPTRPRGSGTTATTGCRTTCRGRRDLDGLADDDGPAARGGAARAAG